MDAQEVKKIIIEETFNQKSYLIGNFHKPNTELVIPVWAAVSVSNPDFLKFVGKEIGNIILEDTKVNLICGIATTGISLAASSSLETGIPWMFARGERKSYGSKEAFDGTYYQNAHVVFVDNLSAKGKGMVPVFESAREEGFTFSHLITIVDYATWAKIPEFAKYNVQVKSLITVDELTDGLNEMGYFPLKMYEYVKSFLKAPGEWIPDSKIVKDFLAELELHKNISYIRALD